MDKNNRGYVGSPVLRREDDRLLRGINKYIDDIPEPAGTLHLAFLRSPYPHARIVSVDLSRVLELAGVFAAYSGADIKDDAKPFSTPTLRGQPDLLRYGLATSVVRYAGEAVAVVAAANPYIAEDALELIDIEFEQLPAVVTVEDALKNETRVHHYLPSNTVFNFKHAVPGTDNVFATAKHVIRDRFSSGRVAHVAMEPRGFLTNFDRGTDKLHHISTAQLPHKMRWDIAEAMGLPEKNVEVIAPHVGGTFGAKTTTYSEDLVGAIVSRKLGRPIKWHQDRLEDLTGAQGRDYHLDVEMAFDDEGHILGVRNRAIADIGAYPLWISTAGLDAGSAGHHMMGPYKIKHYSYDAYSVVSNKAPTSSYRGVGAPICNLATEILLDRMAKTLKIDPIEMRRRNLIRPEDLPFVNAVGVPHDTASHIECLERALKLINYDNFKRKHPGGLEPDGKYRGIGVACVTDHTGQGSSTTRARGQASRWPGYDGCSIRMEPDGKVIAYTSFASQGQGHYTVFAQIIADKLGMAIENVTIEEGDTSKIPFGTGAGASRAAVAGGGAVIKASEKIAAKIKRVGAHLLEASVDDMILADGKVSVVGVPDLSVTIEEVAAVTYMISPRSMPEGETIGIEALEFYDPPHSSYSNATHAVCVAVDARTGRVTIEKYVCVHDCGNVLNPMIVEGQVVGAIAQGIGSVLTEEMRFSEEGQPITTTLLDYTIPTFLDIPEITLDHVVTPSTINPGGMKGAGEGGVVGAVPCIALALTDALREFKPQFNRVPIMPAALLELMNPDETAEVAE